MKPNLSGLTHAARQKALGVRPHGAEGRITSFVVDVTTQTKQGSLPKLKSEREERIHDK
jgi:hypothetical protein